MASRRSFRAPVRRTISARRAVSASAAGFAFSLSPRTVACRKPVPAVTRKSCFRAVFPPDIPYRIADLADRGMQPERLLQRYQHITGPACYSPDLVERGIDGLLVSSGSQRGQLGSLVHFNGWVHVQRFVRLFFLELKPVYR